MANELTPTARAMFASLNAALNAMSDTELLDYGAKLRQRIAEQRAYERLSDEARQRIEREWEAQS